MVLQSFADRQLREYRDAVPHSGGGWAVEGDAGRERVDEHPQVRPPLRGPQITGRRAAAASAADGRLVITGALLRGAVKVAIARNPERRRRGDKGIAQLVALEISDFERAACTVPLIGAASLVLRPLEVRQEIRKPPAGNAPAVIVLGLAADVDEAVDGGRAAQHLAARREDATAAKRGFWLGLIGPVEVGAGEELAVAERHMNPEMPVAWPRLDEQHARARILGKAVGEHAPGRARADDDVVVRVQTVAIGVAGEPTAPGRRSGGAVRRKRLRPCARSQRASSVR